MSCGQSSEGPAHAHGAAGNPAVKPIPADSPAEAQGVLEKRVVPLLFPESSVHGSSSRRNSLTMDSLAYPMYVIAVDDLLGLNACDPIRRHAR